MNELIDSEHAFVLVTNATKSKNRSFYSLKIKDNNVLFVEEKKDSTLTIALDKRRKTITLNNREMSLDYIDEFYRRLDRVYDDIRSGKADVFKGVPPR